ncbi:substrate-binding domain-containing protein [Gordonia caeni]|uniref:ABC transporter substrate-binding protein n=1 Tax=Gordonia caeni TaxID=1007097 RepID=A0ABP7PKX2_9ACTN
MGNHRSGGTRQLFSRPLLSGVLGVMLIIALVLAWRGFGDRIDDGSSATATCFEGDATVPIVADPAIAPALQEIAKNYNAQHPVVRDHCVTVEVRPADASTVLEGLTADTWDAQAHGPYPGAWVPESSIWAAALQESGTDVLAGTPESLVTSPVRLAMEPVIAEAADGDLAWADLPALTRANSLSAFGRSSWGSLRMAMPTGPQSDATSLAAQAVAAATVGTDTALTTAQARSGEVTTAMNELMSAPPRVGDGSAEAAVGSIAETTEPSSAPVRAVPISEQRLYVLTKDDAEASVAVVAPQGQTPMADYPVIGFTSAQLSGYVTDATSEFFTFARKPEQMGILTGAGFRGSGPLPEPTATVRFDEVSDPLPTPEAGAVVAIDRVVLPSAVAGN